MIIALTIAAVAALAFANGANDVSKGVATLAGSRRATYHQALAWGTLWTAAGACAAVMLSFGLVQAFTSALVQPDVLMRPLFPIGVAAAASAWVLFASAAGLPVSTTHALTGAIVGVAVGTGGLGAVSWWLLLASIAAPLALSPLLSAGCGWAAHGVARRIEHACVCADTVVAVSSMHPAGAAIAASAPRVVIARTGCETASGRMRLVAGDLTHWGAAAAVSFARAVNDSPKIAALGVLGFASVEHGAVTAFAVTAAAMTAGSFAAGLRVSRTLGDRVVHMQPHTGLAGAMVTASLVLAASSYTLPVSTTHVASGAIVGAGARQGGGAVQWNTVASLVLAWIVTLPVCAVLGGGVAWWLQTT